MPTTRWSNNARHYECSALGNMPNKRKAAEDVLLVTVLRSTVCCVTLTDYIALDVSYFLVTPHAFQNLVCLFSLVDHFSLADAYTE